MDAQDSAKSEFESPMFKRARELSPSSSRTSLGRVSTKVRPVCSSSFRDPKRSVFHHARLLSLTDSDLSSYDCLFLCLSQLTSLNMSSWSGSAYPPPPRGRSRSRSPYRGGYPPSRPEPGYPPPDPYRGDWDAYDRERAWAQYERERAGYDYARRGRSRSPPHDEGASLHAFSAGAALTSPLPEDSGAQASTIGVTVGAGQVRTKTALRRRIRYARHRFVFSCRVLSLR